MTSSQVTFTARQHDDGTWQLEIMAKDSSRVDILHVATIVIGEATKLVIEEHGEKCPDCPLMDFAHDMQKTIGDVIARHSDSTAHKMKAVADLISDILNER